MMEAPLSRFAPTRRSLEAAAMLGVSLDRARGSARGADDDTPRETVRALLAPGSGRVALILGPSGSGKSTLLRSCGRLLRARGGANLRIMSLSGGRSTRAPLPNRPLVDLCRGSVDEAMRTLACAGLAEAACFVRRPGELSSGQLFRLRLALAMQRARAARSARVVLVIDEFGAELDDATALSVSRLFRRFLDSEPHVCALIAANRAHLAEALAPARLTTLDSAHRALRSDAKRAHSPERTWIISDGHMDDYRALAPHHYRAGLPRAVVRVLVARCVRAGDVLAVLTVSMPTLNSALRSLAWPSRFDSGDKRADAERLNGAGGARLISRLIVDPRWRGCGLATALVRAYLAQPLTPCTEAIAAMGFASRFFESAGMMRYDLPLARRHARLLDLLAQHGIERWRLGAPADAFRMAERRIGAALLARELRLWARASRSTRRNGADSTLFQVFCLAARGIAATPAGFAHTLHREHP